MSERYFLRGKSYISLTDIAEDYDMSKQLLNYRLNTLHMTLEEATALEVRKYMEEITVESVVYPSINKACKTYKRNKGTVMARISDGMDKACAISKKNAREFPYDGKIFKDVKQCCEFYQLPYQGVIQYAKKHDVSKIDAIEYYRKKYSSPSIE